MSQRLRLQRTQPIPTRRLVHFGPGAFFRAFYAAFTQDVMASTGEDWGITAVSLNTSTTRDQLKPQQYAYTAISQSAQETTSTVINSINEVLHAPDDPERVIQTLLEPNVSVVSLTITEKGYTYDAGSGGLNIKHPDIVHDLAHIHKPGSAVGFLVAALQCRKEANLPPFTILSCDNLPSNGKVTRSVVLEFAQQIDKTVATWIEAEVCFPSTMVDRITPATRERDIEALEQSAGYYDPACVVHEPFRQWVIEDNFNSDRPPWEHCGAQLVECVEHHELMKLRCLNGVHSSLAYLGYLAGFDTIAEACSDDTFAELCTRLWTTEIIPTVPVLYGEDLESYCATLLNRFQNPAVRHLTWQIAMDGSQKLPQRLLGAIEDNLNQDRIPEGLILACAAWMRYVSGVDEQGKAIDVRDPLAEALNKAIVNADETADVEADNSGQTGALIRAEHIVSALLDFQDIFSPSLASNALFGAAMVKAFRGLEQMGSYAMVKQYVRMGNSVCD